MDNVTHLHYNTVQHWVKAVLGYFVVFARNNRIRIQFYCNANVKYYLWKGLLCRGSNIIIIIIILCCWSLGIHLVIPVVEQLQQHICEKMSRYMAYMYAFKGTVFADAVSFFCNCITFDAVTPSVYTILIKTITCTLYWNWVVLKTLCKKHLVSRTQEQYHHHLAF